MPKSYDHPLEMPAPAAIIAAADPVYTAPIQIVQSFASVASTTVWAFRNGSTKAMSMRRLRVTFGFVGVPVPIVLRYGLYRIAGATPTGGTAIVPLRLDTASAVSAVADCRFLDTGLTVAGVVFSAAPLKVLSLPLLATLALPVTGVVPGVNSQIDLDLTGIVIRASEGLAINVEGVAAIVGESLIGEWEWSEGSL